MATPVTMPVLGLTMEEGTVAEWLKAEGDVVAKDEPLLTVEMDKGTVEVPSPAAGILRRIVVQPGTTVPIKTVIAEIGDSSEAAPGAAPGGSPDAAPAGSPDAAPAGSPGEAPAGSPDAAPAGSPGEALAGGPGDLPAARPGGPASASTESASPTAAATTSDRRLFASPRARLRAREGGVDLTTLQGTGPNGRIVEADILAGGGADGRVLATPLARRLAQERGVRIGEVQGTGPGGRITQDDVLRVAAQQRQPITAGTPGVEQRAPAPADRAPAPADRAPVTAGRVPVAPDRGPAAEAAADAVTPLSRVRSITAERMAASAQVAARVTLFLDADFSEAARFRTQLQPEFVRLGTAKLPWDALIAKAAALALLDHRAVGAQWVEGEGLRPPTSANIGIAVTLEPEGLVVPVLRDAASRSLRELATDLLALVDKARTGRLSPVDMQGGVFTITNLGAYRVDGFTPIINPPEAAILGVGRIAAKPVVVDGHIEARTMCTLSLSFDHRVVDGAPAAAFLARLAELLERPYALLGI